MAEEFPENTRARPHVNVKSPKAPARQRKREHASRQGQVPWGFEENHTAVAASTKGRTDEADLTIDEVAWRHEDARDQKPILP